jgi:hypothetical protein
MPRSFLQFPVVSEGAEYLVMGYLMRRNILAYKAPPGNEGYDLICIHPDPRHQPGPGEVPQIRIQVKSRYQSDSDRGVPIRASKLDAFDFLVVAFLNIGEFYRGGLSDGAAGERTPEFYTLSSEFVRQHHYRSKTWERVLLRGLEDEIAPFKDGAGFELIAQALGVPRPSRNSTPSTSEIEDGNDLTNSEEVEEP